MKITNMHLYPRRRNVAVQVAEELKTGTYATSPMEERIIVLIIIIIIIIIII